MTLINQYSLDGAIQPFGNSDYSDGYFSGSGQSMMVTIQSKKDPDGYVWSHWMIVGVSVDGLENGSTSRVQVGGPNLPYGDVRCIACFVKKEDPEPEQYGYVTLNTSSNNVFAGTTSPTSQTKTGVVGTTVSFTAVATETAKGKFLYWKEGNSIISYNTSYSFTETITSSHKYRTLKAYFWLYDDKILRHASSGIILRSSSNGLIVRNSKP